MECDPDWKTNRSMVYIHFLSLRRWCPVTIPLTVFALPCNIRNSIIASLSLVVWISTHKNKDMWRGKWSLYIQQENAFVNITKDRAPDNLAFWESYRPRIANGHEIAMRHSLCPLTATAGIWHGLYNSRLRYSRIIRTNNLIANHSILVWDPHNSLPRESPFRIMKKCTLGRDEVSSDAPTTNAIEVDISAPRVSLFDCARKVRLFCRNRVQSCDKTHSRGETE
jgi:hypothetical protein